ncbi:MAG: 4Fe-4S dicluster domain-containing protein [Lachnospiraceae bacterium]|nr:4Fe-4S dicluster domain-containing protein [Lachnospiraceae bacterium]
MILFEREADCCGCGACAQVCPVQAISMQESKTGFLFPKIDANRCIECGKCQKSCGYQKTCLETEPLEAWAASARDRKIEINSASGGIFATIATEIVEAGGVAVGAVMKNTQQGIRVCHVIGKTVEDVGKMQGSKYVQSDAYVVFDGVKKALAKGTQVLFCGTPCQVAAIKKVTGNPDNLFTMDLVCHGVPSQKMFRDFIARLEKDLQIQMEAFYFRSKVFGRNDYIAEIVPKRNKKIYGIPHGLLSFYKLFLDGKINRKSCYQCPFATKQRVADLTIGDYWGIENQHEKEIAEGVVNLSQSWSSILVNTMKGRALLETYGKKLSKVPSKYEKIAERNEQLKMPLKEPKERKELMNLYEKEGYNAVENWFRARMGGKIKFAIKRILGIKKHTKQGDVNFEK